MLDALQRDAFGYFLHETNPANGLVVDKTQADRKYCFKCNFNLSVPHESQGKPGWTSLYHYGVNLGPIILMCENYRSGLLWQLTRRCPYFVTGLRRAGYANGWL